MRHLLADDAGSLYTVHDRHADVHQDDVRVDAPGLLDGLSAVGGLSGHVDVGVPGQQGHHPFAHHQMIIHQQQADFAAPLFRRMCKSYIPSLLSASI